MDEHEIDRAARGLGARAAERLDVERVREGVLARLRADRLRERPGGRLGRLASAPLRVAAMLAVLLAGGLVARGAWERGRARPAAAAPILRTLSTDELEEVYDSLALEAPVHEIAVTGLSSLNEAQLRELLQLMEG